MLEGDRLMSTPYELPFRTDKEHAVLCSKTLGPAELTKFRTAVRDDYYFQSAPPVRRLSLVRPLFPPPRF